MIPDINVLVAASRSDHPHHPQAISWLNETIAACNDGGHIDILPMVAAGFLRLVTHPKVFARPTPTKEAIAFLDALLALPGVSITELSREWPALRRMCRSQKLNGNDIPDAWIAAAVQTINGHLVTFDKDFAKLLDRHQLSILSPPRG